jgi:hypothetical protein
MDCMDDTINRATCSPLAPATMILREILAKVCAAVAAQVPEGYEDESGFHFGAPILKIKTT